MSAVASMMHALVACCRIAALWSAPESTLLPKPCNTKQLSPQRSRQRRVVADEGGGEVVQGREHAGAGAADAAADDAAQLPRRQRALPLRARRDHISMTPGASEAMVALGSPAAG